MSTRLRRLALVLVTVVAACGDDDGTPPGADASVVPDAGDTPDSGGGTPDSGGGTPDSGGGTPDAMVAGNVGDPCTMVSDCLGNYCATEATDGTPGGYCTFVGC